MRCGKHRNRPPAGHQEVIAGMVHWDSHMSFPNGDVMGGVQSPLSPYLVPADSTTCSWPCTPRRAAVCRTLGRRGWGHANVALSVCSYCLPGAHLQEQGQALGPRNPRAFAGSAESIISATTIISSHSSGFSICKEL